MSCFVRHLLNVQDMNSKFKVWLLLKSLLEKVQSNEHISGIKEGSVS